MTSPHWVAQGLRRRTLLKSWKPSAKPRSAIAFFLVECHIRAKQLLGLEATRLLALARKPWQRRQANPTHFCRQGLHRSIAAMRTCFTNGAVHQATVWLFACFRWSCYSIRLSFIPAWKGRDLLPCRPGPCSETARIERAQFGK